MSGSNPTAMRGKGFYNENSRVQQTASAVALPLLVEAADTAPLPAGRGSFVVADYGSSQGRNSLLPMRTVVERIRRRDASVPIEVVHNDLPDNDFSALFRTVATSDQSYLAGATGTFTYAVGRSFFERLFPDDHVRVGWSAIAAHWLSRTVPSAPNHIWCPRNLGRPSEVAAERAALDWQQFLENRAHEMVVGARLVVVVAQADDLGERGGDGYLNLLNRVLRGMVDDGAVGAAEVARLSIATYFRTADELRAPFERGVLGKHLFVDHFLEAPMADPLWSTYEADGDADAFGRGYTGWLRAFSEPALVRALDAARGSEEQRRLVDEVYDHVLQEATASPESARCQWQMAALSIGKR
jgi:hypothetical protein